MFCDDALLPFIFTRWPAAIEMLAAKSIDVMPMVTHSYSLEETLAAFDMAKSGKGVKVIIDCQKKTAA